MAATDSSDEPLRPGGPEGDALAEVRAATRALNEALGALTRSVADSSVRSGRQAVTGAARSGQAALAGSLEQAAKDLGAASQRLASAGTGSARPRSADTRQRLLAAGRSVFAAKGYEGASVNDIAAAAGFTKGAFYSAFPSKEALLIEIASCELEAADARDLRLPTELADLPVQEVLLQLELCLYALRHQDTGKVLSQGWQRSVVETSRAVARHRGREEPVLKDREDAFMLIATTLLAAIVGPAFDVEGVDQLAAGAYRRILEEPTDPADPAEPA